MAVTVRFYDYRQVDAPCTMLSLDEALVRIHEDAAVAWDASDFTHVMDGARFVTVAAWRDHSEGGMGMMGAWCRSPIYVSADLVESWIFGMNLLWRRR